MSDAMGAVEIEDVLSSIRRLVSEDLRPAAPRAALPEPRLILTPALRVVPEAPLDEGWAEDEAWTEVPPPAHLSPRGWSLPEAEPEPAELDVPHAVPLQPFSARSPRTEGASELSFPLAPHRFTLTQAARVVSDDSPEDPQSWDQPADGIAPWSFAPEVAGPDAPVAQGAAAPQDAMAAQDVWADQAAAEAIADIEANAEDDDPLEVISDADPAFQDDAGPASEVTYDEDLLRDLVRDILREELAGTLGEKITRNVRKLVRAEIAQALATRDLG